MTSLWTGEFSRLLFFLEGVVLIFDISVQVGSHHPTSSERYCIKVVYQARPASDSVEGTRVPRSPPYLSVIDERPPALSNILSAFLCD